MSKPFDEHKYLVYGRIIAAYSPGPTPAQDITVVELGGVGCVITFDGVIRCAYRDRSQALAVFKDEMAKAG